MDTSNTTTTAAATATATATGTKSVNYNFRAIKSDHSKFAEARAQFDAAPDVTYTTELADDGVSIASIKRDTLTVELPVLGINQFSEAFINELIMDQIIDAVRKEFVDENKPVDVSQVTASWVESALAAKRAAAISTEEIAEFANVITAALTQAGKPEGTVKVIGELIKGKFGKRVLKSYSQLKDQFVGVATLIEKVIAEQDAATISKLTPVFELLVNNLEKFLNAEEEEVLDLDLA